MSSANEMKQVAAGFLAAARGVTGEGNWHGKKVFLAALYAALGAAGTLSREEFGVVLVELHQARLIRLSRMDLDVGSVRALKDASEIVSRGERFHFIRID